ncbi:protein HOTHEAD-like isoform X2 [Iris pallida]|uniref:Protein HOTHEAD-like isoform X2 n=1 Tax=Iris pallida TaxID=29817 RepID=A0AAX6H9E1_IRIPA|nr:protein HOTHEAD-like isoform X2 [Iris pallida]
MALETLALLLKILLTFSLLSSSQGKEVSNVGQMHFFKANNFSLRPSHEHYDYIIVLYGTTRCLLAVTLSQTYSMAFHKPYKIMRSLKIDHHQDRSCICN